MFLLSGAPDFAQSNPEDNDKRKVDAVFNALTRKKPGSDFASSLKLPHGYRASVRGPERGNTRMMAVAPDGSVYGSRRSDADIIRLVDANLGCGVDGPPTAIVNRSGLHGVTIHHSMLNFMMVRELSRAPLRPDGSIGAVGTLMDDLPDGGQHFNRTLAVGPNKLLYINAGSTCNACDE